MNKSFKALSSYVFLSIFLCLSCAPSISGTRFESGRLPFTREQHDHSLHSTVGILSPNLRPDGSHYFTCTAVAVSRNYILTAEHCVDNDLHTIFGEVPGRDPVGDVEEIISYEMYRATGFERTLPYQVVAVDDLRDLALLRRMSAEELDGLTYAPLQPSTARMEVFDAVYVIGHPVGVNFNTSDGYVSRPIFTVDDQRHQGKRILTNAQVYMGNSGGPVFNSRGQLVGIISEIAGGQPYLNRAVYIDTVRDFLEEQHLTDF